MSTRKCGVCTSTWAVQEWQSKLQKREDDIKDRERQTVADREAAAATRAAAENAEATSAAGAAARAAALDQKSADLTALDRALADREDELKALKSDLGAEQARVEERAAQVQRAEEQADQAHRQLLAMQADTEERTASVGEREQSTQQLQQELAEQQRQLQEQADEINTTMHALQVWEWDTLATARACDARVHHGIHRGSVPCTQLHKWYAQELCAPMGRSVVQQAAWKGGWGGVQETEQDVAQREEEVNRNVRINLQLQEDVAAARKEVDERTKALSSAITVPLSVSQVPRTTAHAQAACTHTPLQ